MKTFLFILGASAALVLAESERIPRRVIPPLPLAPESAKESKKVNQARLLREAAEVIESEAMRELEELSHSISNKIVSMDLSTDRFSVKVKAISFMQVGTNQMAQITFEYQEK